MGVILGKEKNLIKAMKEQDFQPFFDGNRDDAFNTIAEAFDSFSTYQNTVIRMTAMQPIIYAHKNASSPFA